MSYSGEAAEQVVRMSLNGIEIAAKISGKAAERLAVLLYAVLKDQKRTKGKVRLTNMLRSGKELKVFAVQDHQLDTFSRAAKQYGVLYCMLKDRKNDTGLTDIMVRADDAGKINRIFERFSLATVDMGSVKTEIERSRSSVSDLDSAVPEPERNDQVKNKVEEFMEKVLPENNPNKEKNANENPSLARSTKSNPSGRSSEKTEMDKPRPSVRKEMEEIRKEQKELRNVNKSRQKGKNKMLAHKAPKKKQTRKERTT